MTQYVAQTLSLEDEQASALRNAYWLKYGATLLGMIRHHGVDAQDFLDRTHVLPDLRRQIVPNPRMRQLLMRLPGNRILLTNAPLDYTRRVLRQLRIDKAIHAVVSIDHMWIHSRLQPKPAALLWPALQRQVPGARHVLFEDTLGHLKTVRGQAMGTVWIVPPLMSAGQAAGKPPFVDHKVRHFGQCRPWIYRAVGDTERLIGLRKPRSQGRA